MKKKLSPKVPVEMMSALERAIAHIASLEEQKREAWKHLALLSKECLNNMEKSKKRLRIRLNNASK